MRDRCGKDGGWVGIQGSAEELEMGSQERKEMRVQRAVRGGGDICDPLAVQVAAEVE